MSHVAIQATNIAKLEQQYSLLEQKASASDFWDSQDTAQATLQRMSDLKSSLDVLRGFKSLLSDVQTAIELAELEVRPALHLLMILAAWPPGCKDTNCGGLAATLLLRQNMIMCSARAGHAHAGRRGTAGRTEGGSCHPSIFGVSD